MTLTVLAHIQCCKVESEDLDLTYQGRKLSLRYITFTISQQTLTHKLQIGKQLLRMAISNVFFCWHLFSCTNYFAILNRCCIMLLFICRKYCCFQTLPDKGELASVRFLGGLRSQL